MNIISTNCLAGHLYRDLLKCEYKNPFIKAGTTISILGFLLFIFVLFRFKIINVQNVSI